LNQGIRPGPLPARRRAPARILASAALAWLATVGPGVAQDGADDRPFDLVLTGGQVFDGSGAPPRRLDLGIRGGRITALGELAAADATRRIELAGLAVAPGFIDLHAHADAVALRRPQATNFVAMGVTTLITGNCGSSAADLAAHLTAVERRGIGVNYGSLIGHGTVRGAVLGTANRAPTADELRSMRGLVERAMAAGAFGLSTGLIYVPGTFATTAEIAALAAELAPFGGVYATHMRDEGDGVLRSIDEALRIGAEAGVAVHISHLKASGRPNWGRGAEIAARLRAARAAGQRVTGDQYAYTASSTGLDVLFPSDALAVGRRAFGARLRDDPAFRAAMVAAVRAGTERSGFDDLEHAQVASAPGTEAANGLRIPAVAALLFGDQGLAEQAETVVELTARAEGRRVGMVYHKMAEADVETLLRLPFVAVASDAGIRGTVTTERPHPRGAGNNPRVLGRYVRERRSLPLALAVHKMSGLPAAAFGIEDRGSIRRGAFADLVVFDPGQVLDGATYEDPTTAPAGIRFVFVNGAAAVDEGAPTGALAGQVLRRRGPAR
jgi:N-acyl-D-amino-acid deacylase